MMKEIAESMRKALAGFAAAAPAMAKILRGVNLNPYSQRPKP